MIFDTKRRKSGLLTKAGVCLMIVSLLGTTMNYYAWADDEKDAEPVQIEYESEEVAISSNNDETLESEPFDVSGDRSLDSSDSTEELTEESTEKSIEESTEKSIEESTEQSIEESTEESQDATTESTATVSETNDALEDVNQINSDDSQLVGFEEKRQVGDVEVSVTADIGVFPEGASLEVRAANSNEEKMAEEVISDVRDEDKNVAASYTFDIKVKNKDGEEIQPDNEKGSVRVAFRLNEVSNANLETEVYHIEGMLSDEKSAENCSLTELPIEEENGENQEQDVVSVTTDGFSYYTVEFTYNSVEYVLEGGEEVALTEILDTVRLDYSAGIEKVVSSDDDLFYAERENVSGKWFIHSVKAFGSKETLTVSIGGIDYVIEVTDSGTDVVSYTVGGNTTKYQTFEAALSASEANPGGELKLLENVTTTKAIVFNKDVSLNMNDHELNVKGFVTGGKGNTGIKVCSDVLISGPGKIIKDDFKDYSFGSILLSTESGATCTIDGGVEIIADVSGYSSQIREVVACAGGSIIIKNANIRTENATNSTAVAILVSWTGDIKIYDGEFKWGEQHTDWSGVLDSVGHIYVYGGKFQGRIWQSGGGVYSFYKGEFTEANVYNENSKNYEDWNVYVQDATVTDRENEYYRYLIEKEFCSIKTSVNSANAGTASSSDSVAEKDATVKFTANPKQGYKFVNWTDESGKQISAVNPFSRSFTQDDMKKIYSIRANFALNGSPSVTATAVNDSISINWNKVNAASRYELYVSKSSDFSSCVSGYGPKNINSSTFADSLTGLDVSTTYYIKVVAKDTEGLSCEASTNATTGKRSRNGITVQMSGYTYNQQQDITAPTLNPANVEENPTVTYFYSSTNAASGGSKWTGINPTTLKAGTYYMYATLAETASYKAYTTGTTEFTVSKATCAVTPPSVELTYGTKLSAATITGGSAPIQGSFDWKDDTVKNAKPQVSDSGVTTYDMVFTPSGEDADNYAPVTCPITVTVNPKSINPAIDVRVNTSGEVSEKIIDDNTVLNINTDYDREVVTTDKGTYIEYVIKYNFKGNYRGDSTKKLNVPKKQQPDPGNDNIVTLVDNESAEKYSPIVEAVPKSNVKSLIATNLDDNSDVVDAQLSGKSFTRDELKVGLISESSSIVVESNVSLEMQEREYVEISGAEKQLIEKVANSLDAADDMGYLDISMYISYVIKDSASNELVSISREKITDTQDSRIEKKFENAISIEVPAEMRMVPNNFTRTYYVVRVHDDDATILVETQSTFITFKTDKFSTYALMYKDTPIPDEKPAKKDKPKKSWGWFGPIGLCMTDSDEQVPNGLQDSNAEMVVNEVHVAPVVTAPLEVAGYGHVSPKTGDTVDLYLWMAMFVVGVLLIVIDRKQRICKDTKK